MVYDRVRIDLESWEYDFLKEFVLNTDKIKNSSIFESIIKKIENPKIIKYSDKKREASEIATLARTKQVREKINKAVKELELDLKRGFIKKISYFAISKKSGVHLNTVKKYHFF